MSICSTVGVGGIIGRPSPAAATKGEAALDGKRAAPARQYLEVE